MRFSKHINIVQVQKVPEINIIKDEKNLCIEIINSYKQIRRGHQEMEKRFYAHVSKESKY